MSKFWKRDRKAGMLIYPLGDVAAQAILGSFSISRMCALALAGALIYAAEIPRWFRFIERRWHNPWIRTMAAISYFNPLWIARHFLIMWFFENPGAFMSWDGARIQLILSLELGVKSFFGAVVLSVIGNYIIQNRVEVHQRFLASSIFSGLLAMYYGLAVLFAW